ncbi:unnamed protein product [Effrenium voratum]|uniref:tRNA (guanine(46)-N(7))-methyltransferase n=1 Tax=Effrenium voratum TaxID=2562239 RepID=A0AA36MZJ2_9DINO|nr:unnamed protein product [Effrenium voratum]
MLKTPKKRKRPRPEQPEQPELPELPETVGEAAGPGSRAAREATEAADEPGIERTAAGLFQVCLTPLPKGSSQKGLRSFMGNLVPASLQLDSAAGQANVCFQDASDAKLCLERWNGLNAALTSAPKKRRRLLDPSQKPVFAGPARSAPRAPIESRGFSESEDEHVDLGAKPKGGPSADGSSELLALTRKIASFAAQRRLSDAIKTFDRILAKGLAPSVQAYASLLNAHVNSGDMPGAASTFRKMLADGLRSNVVVATALLKGYCRAGDIQAASGVLQDMMRQDPPVKPDLRLVNTLLRGCVRVGDLQTAESVFDRLAEWQLQPDASNCIFLVSLLSQRLRTKSIGALLRKPPLEAVDQGNLLSQPTTSTSSDQNICRFWAKGKCNKGSACPFFHDSAVAKAKKDRDEPERLAAVASVSLHLAHAAALSGKTRCCVRALCGVESAHAAAKDLPRARNASKEQQQSKQREQEQEVKAIRDFLASQKKGPAFNFSDFLGRCFLVPAGFATLEPAERCQALASELQSWGLRQPAQEPIQQRFARCLQEGRLRWSKVFGSQAPVKLELGAGSGEWVAAQAKADETNWVALELMRDRAHSVLRRAAFQDLRNICVVCGEATKILEHLVPNCCISHVFINFPEPPFVSGDEAAESNFHMVTPELFAEMHRILRKECQITILSDNHRYMQSLARMARIEWCLLV